MPTSTPDTAETYDRGNTSRLFWASNKATMHTGPTDTATVATAAQYTAISTSDNSRWSTNLASSTAGDDSGTEINSQMYKFCVSTSGVNWFEVRWEGFGEAMVSHAIRLDIWNYSASAWEVLDTNEGYDTLDRVMGNRRWEIPNNNISAYVNRTATPNELTVRAIAQHHTASTCPILFGWNGESQKYIGPVISTSIIKRYEMPTYAQTTVLEPRDGYYEMMLAQMMPDESHMNSLGLWVVDHPVGTEVWADQWGSVYTVSDPQPVIGVDRDGNDVSSYLSTGTGWSSGSNSGPRDFSKVEDLYDWITITLPDAPQQGTAKLLVDLGMTELDELTLWEYYHGILGTTNMRHLMDLVENDPTWMAAFDQAVGGASSVYLEYWNGSDWVDYEYMFNYPMKTGERTCVIPLDLSLIQGGQLRLCFPWDWVQIGQVMVDYTPDAEMEITQLEPVEAIKYHHSEVEATVTEDVLDEISGVDDSYAVILPGDYIYYKFPALDEPAEGLTRSFIAPCQGYYYLIGSEMPEDKIENEAMLLEMSQTPLAYNQWILQRYLDPGAYPELKYYNIGETVPDWGDLIVDWDALQTDYVKVVTHTSARPVQMFTPSGRLGNWYLYYVYYRDTDGDPLNYTYWIETIDRVGQTGYLAVADNGAESYSVTNCDHADWHMPLLAATRMRRVAAPTIGSAPNYMYDTELYTNPWGSEVSGKMNAQPRVPSGTGNGMSPAQNFFLANNASADWNIADYGAPWATDETFHLREYINADPIETGNDQWMQSTLQWTNQSYITGYNISDSTTCPLVQGFGKFGGYGVYDVSQIRTVYSALPGAYNDNASREQLWYYNTSVESWVRKFDSLRYYGVEDNVLVAYESEDFYRSNLVVTDTNGGQVIDVSINITNPFCTAQKFNALLCIMNLNDLTATDLDAHNQKLFIDGHTVFPNLSAPGGSWPYFSSAIKTTSTLNPGQTETVTWSNAYTLVSGQNYWLWCSGMFYGPWRAP